MTVHYEIKHLNKPYSANGLNLPDSVLVSELLDQKQIREFVMGVYNRHEIYDLIERKEPVILKDVYVPDFSLSEYRTIHNLPHSAEIEIGEWMTDHCFFDCGSSIDFTFARFTKGANFQNSMFYHGTLDFTHAVFEGPENNFKACHFGTHKAVFQYSEFLGDITTFELSVFTCVLVSFINASFRTAIDSFKRVHFTTGKVKFHFADFGDGFKNFEKMKFHGTLLDFRRVAWNRGKVDFRRCVFGPSHITFEEMEMTEGKMSFRMSSFEGGLLTFRRSDFGKDEVNFDHVKFGCNAISFEGCTAGRFSLYDTDIRSSLDLRLKKARTIDLSSAFLYSVTDLNFERGDAVDFLVMYKLRNLGKMIMYWEKNEVLRMISSQQCPDSHKADQFNVVKDNFARNGQYNDEDKAYVCFKRYEHRVLRLKHYKRLGNWGFLAILYFHFRKIIFDRLGLFATSPGRVLFSMVLIISTFAIAYTFVDLFEWGQLRSAIDPDHGLNMFQKSLYHSAITFFTIGYGDFYPTGFNRVVSALEGWIGVFLMAYFTVAFVRKALR